MVCLISELAIKMYCLLKFRVEEWRNIPEQNKTKQANNKKTPLVWQRQKDSASSSHLHFTFAAACLSETQMKSFQKEMKKVFQEAKSVP